MHKQARVGALAFGLLAASYGIAAAESGSPYDGAVEGTISDAAGKPVAGAFVRLKNPERRLSFMVISQDGGAFAAKELPAGHYDVQSIGGDFQSKPAAVTVDDRRVRSEPHEHLPRMRDVIRAEADIDPQSPQTDADAGPLQPIGSRAVERARDTTEIVEPEHGETVVVAIPAPGEPHPILGVEERHSRALRLLEAVRVNASNAAQRELAFQREHAAGESQQRPRAEELAIRECEVAARVQEMAIEPRIAAEPMSRDLRRPFDP